MLEKLGRYQQINHFNSYLKILENSLTELANA